ncbi:hypothetical protein HYC85_021818 [Camellia sinensis]|uniref:Uncharacterized protein n=1 Tax=Camellia sinensis TaxID=4442 RepID=A0A7J7GL66_CAMSI|nr:hypothetical protein HYC85_021818 [Camellia sinensis]
MRWRSTETGASMEMEIATRTTMEMAIATGEIDRLKKFSCFISSDSSLTLGELQCIWLYPSVYHLDKKEGMKLAAQRSCRTRSIRVKLSVPLLLGTGLSIVSVDASISKSPVI